MGGTGNIGDEEEEGDPVGKVGNGDISSSGSAESMYLAVGSFHLSRVNLRGPGTGVRPSRKAFARSAAFHLAYAAFCSIYAALLVAASSSVCLFTITHLFRHTSFETSENLNELTSNHKLPYCSS